MSGAPILEQELTPASLPFQGEQLSPSPYHFRFTGEDSLEIVSYNAATGVRIAVQGRTWTPESGIHAFAFDHVPSTDASRDLEVFGLARGYLLNVVVFASSGSPRVGQTFVSLHVIRGRDQARVLLATLLQGYVTAEQQLAFPGSPVRTSFDGGGYLRTVTGTLPGAGSNVLETVPTGRLWELRALRVEYTTSGGGPDRRIILRIGNLSVSWLISISTGVHPGGFTFEYFWGPSVNTAVIAGVLVYQLPLPVPCPLRAADLFTISVLNRQVGDVFTAPIYQVEEWLEAQLP